VKLEIKEVQSDIYELKEELDPKSSLPSESLEDESTPNLAKTN
tara:strand:+ start:696 stop:824 length:129 start_codon:yes stop_codon:yes gene_type:complete